MKAHEFVVASVMMGKHPGIMEEKLSIATSNVGAIIKLFL